MLAARKVLARRGQSPEQTWQLVEGALQGVFDALPTWQTRFSSAMFFSFATRLQLRWLSGKDVGGWRFTYVTEGGDFGVDYERCALTELMHRHGEQDFAPFVCRSDRLASDALGWGLHRSETLASGCGRCDFRFERGRDTHITR